MIERLWVSFPLMPCVLLPFKLLGVYCRLWIATNPVVYSIHYAFFRTVRSRCSKPSRQERNTKLTLSYWRFQALYKTRELFTILPLNQPSAVDVVYMHLIWNINDDLSIFWSMFDRFEGVWSNENVGLSTIVELFDLAITRPHDVGINGHAGMCNDIVLCLASPWHLSIFLSESVRLLSEHC